jgi:hypothetical protein
MAAAGLFAARVNGGDHVAIYTARVLPRLASPVPMKTKFGQGAGNSAGLLVWKLNPNPLANHFGQGIEVGNFRTEQRQQLPGVQRAIHHAASEIDLRSVSRAQLFGSVLEP